MKLLLRWIINAVALIAATQIIAGFYIESFYAALIAALVLGLLNALVRPVLFVLTLPLTVVTLGLFTFVLNAGMIWFMSTFVKGVFLEGFFPAIMVSLFLWAVGTLTSAVLHSSQQQASRS